jgi:hypothetical protein
VFRDPDQQRLDEGEGVVPGRPVVVRQEMIEQ